MSTVARKVRIHGRVQGVFFRDTCMRVAGEQGVAGWVGNEPDGSVSAWFEGDEDAVEAMLRWCHDGPTHAKVQRVDVSEVDPEGMSRFTVR